MGTLPKIDAHRLAKLQDGPLAGALAGELVGPWRLLRELGEGGMGSVWLAERADGAYQRQVALKLPRLSWARGLAERLARERDILATLEHPRIARLYDAGVDLQGRPWLALEHVQGLPLDTHAREARLDTPSRVRLLLQVCEAVAHAHSRLVIHRDLKPANILVDQAGQVKLLDFGIAKLVQGDVAAATALTELQGRALTLDYASPEQVRGEPLTTASDIYSLGVVAFELLAGARPYKLRRGSAAELEEAIEVAEIPPASRAAVDPDTRAALRGDLDAVLRKALQKAPIARYTNVDALAEDLQAVLEGRAVRARPDTALQRAGRWLRRHRWAAAGATAVVAAFALAVGVGATTMVIVALAAGLAAAWWQAVQARRGRFEAEAATARANAAAEAAIREAARAGAIGDFMVRVFSHNSDKQVDPESARQRSAAELLTRGVQEIDSLQAAHPQAHAQLLLTFGDLHLELQLHDAARDLFERSLASARSAFGEEHLETQRARTRLAGFLIGTPRGAEGRALVEQAHAVLRRTAPRSMAMAETLSELCSQFLQRDPERAIAFGHEAVALMDQLDAGGAGYREAKARQRLGRAYRYADDVESAGRWLGEATERLVALYGEDSVHATESRLDLAQTRMLTGSYDEAKVLWQQLLARFEARPRASVDSRLESMRGLASSHLMLGEPVQALAVLDVALALLDEGLAPRMGEGQRWQTQTQRAGVLLAQGKIDEALAITLPLRAALPPDLLVVRTAVLRFVMQAWHWTGACEAMVALEDELTSVLQVRRGSGFRRQELLSLVAAGAAARGDEAQARSSLAQADAALSPHGPALRTRFVSALAHARVEAALGGRRPQLQVLADEWLPLLGGTPRVLPRLFQCELALLLVAAVPDHAQASSAFAPSFRHLRATQIAGAPLRARAEALALAQPGLQAAE